MSRQSAPDFLHCNHCLTRDIIDNTFFVTRCLKVFCRLCRKKNQLNGGFGCDCGSVVCQTLPLNDTIDDCVKAFFRDTKQLKRDLLKAVVFQTQQRLHLIHGLNDKIRRLETENSRLKSNEYCLAKENQRIKCENQRLRSSLSETNEPLIIQNSFNSRNNNQIIGLKLSDIFRTQNEFQPMAKRANLSSNADLFKFSDSYVKSDSIDSIRSQQSIYSSDFRRKSQNIYSSSMTPMSVDSTGTNRFNSVLFTRTPSSLSSLSAMNHGIRQNKDRVIHKIIQKHR